MDPADPEARSSHQLGAYRLERKLAAGGMGEVYLATDVRLGRPVAIKTLRAAACARPEAIERFRREARLLASLQHPGIVSVFDVGEADGRAYLVQEYVEGETLADRIARGPIHDLEAARILLELAEAVAHAHERGVVHRDLKPSNVLLDRDGRARLTDFGVGWGAGEASLTETGEILGTVAYMAPEQIDGESTPLSDVYGLGAILYSMATGRPPVTAADTESMFRQILHQEPVDPRTLRPALDPRLVAICNLCLAREPELRYAGANEIARDLRDLLGPTSEEPDPGVEISFEGSGPPTRSLRARFGLAILGLAAAAVAYRGLLATRPEPPEAKPGPAEDVGARPSLASARVEERPAQDPGWAIVGRAEPPGSSVRARAGSGPWTPWRMASGRDGAFELPIALGPGADPIEIEIQSPAGLHASVRLSGTR